MTWWIYPETSMSFGHRYLDLWPRRNYHCWAWYWGSQGFHFELVKLYSLNIWINLFYFSKMAPGSLTFSQLNLEWSHKEYTTWRKVEVSKHGREWEYMAPNIEMGRLGSVKLEKFLNIQYPCIHNQIMSMDNMKVYSKSLILGSSTLFRNSCY